MVLTHCLVLVKPRQEWREYVVYLSLSRETGWLVEC
jgi:hypothetical protein